MRNDPIPYLWRLRQVQHMMNRERQRGIEALGNVFKLLDNYKMVFAAIQCNTLKVAVPYLWRQRQVHQIEQGTPKGN